jgi:hypothetical protein
MSKSKNVESIDVESEGEDEIGICKEVPGSGLKIFYLD